MLLLYITAIINGRGTNKTMDTSVNPALLMQHTQVSLLKTALEMQSQAAMALINSIPQTTSSESSQLLPSNLGNHINTTA
jgi:hypothetical protein